MVVIVGGRTAESITRTLCSNALEDPSLWVGPEVNERQKNAIDAMNRSIEKLQALVDDVMDVYKLDMGKLKFSVTDTDITKLRDQPYLQCPIFQCGLTIHIPHNFSHNNCFYDTTAVL